MRKAKVIHITKTVAAAMLMLLTMVSCRREDVQSLPEKSTEKIAAVSEPPAAKGYIQQKEQPVQGREAEESPLVSQRVRKGESAKIAARGVVLDIGAGALTEDADISVTAVKPEESGAMGEQLSNVTSGGVVYRMLPDGQQFEKEITIAMGYDSTAIPVGYTADDIYTYYYDEQLRSWQQVPRERVDEELHIVYSKTTHFTDYINGVLKEPDNSDATAYTPTTMRDMRAVEPLEGISLIGPAEGNSRGTASMTYPLQVPVGRGGMEPRLAVSYSSGGGSGVLGEGWSLPVSEVSVETRWGVPRYSATEESEGYLLDGSTLVTGREENGLLRLDKPVYHRAYEARATGGETRFYPRVEGSFRKIVRKGATPSSYYWEVTDKDGTRHIYGQSEGARLTTEQGNIARWLLEKSVDTYGNTVKYSYTTRYDRSGGGAGLQVCLERIDYSGNEEHGESGAYSIRFTYSERSDKRRSFRYGVEESDAWILDRVTVSQGNRLVKEYWFGYREGVFGKSLLCNILETYDDGVRHQLYPVGSRRLPLDALGAYERCGIEFAAKDSQYVRQLHSFDYYGVEGTGLFGPEVTMGEAGGGDALATVYDSAFYERGNLGGSVSGGWNIGGGINAGTDYFPWLKTITVGGQYSFHKDTTQGLVTLADLDGDGYPDKLYRSGGRLWCRRQAGGERRFGAAEEVQGIGSFMRAGSSTHNWGLEVNAFSVVGAGCNWSDSRSTTTTYLTDANGDGLPDIVDNGRVYINRGNLHFDDVTDNDTVMVGGACPGDAIGFGGEVEESIFDDGYYTVERRRCDSVWVKTLVYDTLYDSEGGIHAINQHEEEILTLDGCETLVDTFYSEYPQRYEPNIDLVRMWKAPYSGRVTISGTAQLSDSLADYRAMTRTTDGVRVSVQKNNSELMTRSVTPGSGAEMTTQVNVNEGDILYFRIGQNAKRLYDDVEWNPVIQYGQVRHRNGVRMTDGSREDANGDKIYRYEYSGDYMLAGLQAVSVGDTNGGICRNSYRVRCRIKVTKPLTQDVRYRVMMRSVGQNTGGTPMATHVIPRGTLYDEELQDMVTNVPENRMLVLVLDLAGGGQVSWSSIESDAEVTLTGSTSPMLAGCLQDSNQRKAFVYHPVVERSYRDYMVYPSEPVQWSQGNTRMDVRVGTSGSPIEIASLAMTVKSGDGSVLHQGHIQIIRGHVTPVDITLPQGSHTYSVDFYTDNPELAVRLRSIDIRFGGRGGWSSAGLYTKYCADSTKHHGTLYRGWGQFGYKSGDGTAAIDPAQTEPPAYYSDSSAVPNPGSEDIDNFDVSGLDADSSPESEIGGISSNPLNATFFEMRADTERQRWISYGNAVAAYRAESSLDNSDAESENGEVPEADDSQSPLPVVTPGTKIKAVNRQSLSKGFGATALTLSYSQGKSRQLGDYMDLNGDRYPDIVGEKAVQYSEAQGGLGSDVRGYSSSDDGVSRSLNQSGGVTFNGTYLRAAQELSGRGKGSQVTTKTTGLSQMPSFGGAMSRDSVQSAFIDVNGDGLPDIVYADNRVRYNQGYSFTGMRPYYVRGIHKSVSTTTSAGVSVNIANTSIAGGLGINLSDNHSIGELADLNGDGLPDIALEDRVYVSRGDGSYIEYANNLGMLDRSRSTTFSVNAGGTLDMVFPIMGFPLKVGFSLAGGGTAGLSATAGEFRDMDNDGYADYVYRSGGAIKVRYSQVGRANLLKSVKNFGKGGSEIDYELGESSVGDPHRQWCLSSQKVWDGFAGDGADTLYRRYSYGSRRYSRYEREDYGYDSVTTYEYASRDDYESREAARTTLSTYHNGDYYHGYLPSSERVSDREGRYSETRYSYRDADLRDGHYLDDGTPAWCQGDGWPALSAEETTVSEGSSATLTSRREYRYGSYGNVTQCQDMGDVADAGDDYTAVMAYHEDPAHYVVGSVSEFAIEGLRHRQASYNERGRIDQLTIDNGGSQSRYSYKYDGYGNLTRLVTPAESQADGSRYWILYEYDSATHTLPVSVKNAEGYHSEAEYDLRWQKPLHTQDIGGNHLYYSYDAHGNVATVTAPREQATGAPYTVKFDYWYNHRHLTGSADAGNQGYNGASYPLWSQTGAYDERHPGDDIEAVVFSDGQGRIVQDKKDIEEEGEARRQVSGKTEYDGLWRKVRESQPTSEPQDWAATRYNPYSSDYSTAIAYDYLDRPVREDYADSSHRHYEYSIAADGSGAQRLKTAVTDRNGVGSAVYSDMRRQTRQTTDALGGETKYRYDAIGQLVATIDPEGHETSHSYDLGGRRVSRTHPSSGTTQWQYDAAGNLTKLTLNSGASVDYEYDYRKLQHESHPQREWNDVWYKYVGGGNGAGQVSSRQDASGVTEYGYDETGNVTESRKTCVIPGNRGTLTMVTRWSYDSHGRVQTVTYPDGEEVSYTYDRGGSLCGMAGEKPGQPRTVYIDTLQYNKYGQRTYIRYGNGVATTYSYEPVDRRLTHLRDSSSLTGELLQDNSYSYDAEGNILGIADQGRLGRVQSYRYDDLYRLVRSQGEMGVLGLSYDSEYGYSAAGRLTKKRVSSLRLGSRGLYPVNYDNEYRYPYGSNPFAAERITDGHGNHDLKWDDDGNMTGCGDEERERRMCWTEEGRLQAYWDRQREEGVQAAYYSYDGAGERSLKLVSPRVETVQNAEQGTVSMRYATLYASPLVTINRGGYTKHYFEGGHRVCTAVGGGFGGVDWSEVEEQVPAVSGSYSRMHEMQDEGVNKAFEGCFGVGASVKGVYNLPAILEKQERWRNVAEPLHFYHGDHLGSAAYLTDRDGHVVQTLAYLPYGEDWVEQNGLGDTSRLGMYRYNGKERDGESGYLYYGARYYWSELWNGWLSVDPMADKYPGASPYAYCVWNPVKLMDINGMDTIFSFACKLENNKQNHDNAEILSWLRREGDTPGLVTFSMHGSSKEVLRAMFNGELEEPCKASDIVNLINKSELPDYRRNKDSGRKTIFILYSCNTGEGCNSFAEQLSDKLQEVVIAPQGLLRIRNNGHTMMNISGKTNTTEQPWNVFYRGRKVTSFKGLLPKQWIERQGGIDKAIERIQIIDRKNHPWE
jgi:RHS repeat-associated protein